MLKNLYSNGSSLTAGGGLYEPGNKQEYKRLYGVEWDNEKDVTYPKYVADDLNLKLISDAECGSGAPRLVRRTYEYIESVGLEKAKETLFLFEITDPIHRIDMFCNEINDHVIVNVRYDDDAELTDLSVVYSYSPTNRPYDNNIFKGDIENGIRNYLNAYHNPVVYSNKFAGELIGLFSFMDKLNLQFYYMFENEFLRNPYKSLYYELDRKHKIHIDEDCTSSSHFCIKNKLTIKDELNGFTDDTHPGYYGYLKFAEVVKRNIIKSSII